MTEQVFDKDRVMGRIRKLMALANDGGATEGERDNAMRMAHSTLAKYNLSMAEVEQAAGSKQQEKRGPASVKSRSRPWIRQCMQAVAELFFCEYFFVKSGGNDQLNFFVGRESNVLTAIEIAQYVVNSIKKESAAQMRARGETIAWRISFQKGATLHVRLRCKDLRAEQERELAPACTGTSLVLASFYQQEQAANADYVKQQMGITLHTKQSRETDPGAGYWEGAEYGKKVGLHRQLT